VVDNDDTDPDETDEDGLIIVFIKCNGTSSVK
jgi:hypothetical protein